MNKVIRLPASHECLNSGLRNVTKILFISTMANIKTIGGCCCNVMRLDGNRFPGCKEPIKY